MKAIVVPYSVDQNQPSRPFNQLFEMGGEDQESRMIELWYSHNDPDREWAKDISVLDKTNSDGYNYGDYEVGNGDLILFFTIVKG